MSVVFFFKQKTAYEMRISDWSSDVCSSDLDSASRITPVPLQRGQVMCEPSFRAGRRRWRDSSIRPKREILPICTRARSKCKASRRRCSTARWFLPSSMRSEERRVGKECVSMWRCRWSQYHQKNKYRYIQNVLHSVHTIQLNPSPQ